MADSERKIPEIEIRIRWKFVSAKTKIVNAERTPIIRKILGIRFDLRVRFPSAKLNAFRAEDKIINASIDAMPMLPTEPIKCAKYRLPKKATALENSQIYTARVLICITRRQIEKITSSPIRKYLNINNIGIRSVFDVIVKH